MLRSIAEQKLKLFRTIDSLGQKELYDVENMVSEYLEKKMKEKESLYSIKKERPDEVQSGNSSEIEGFWKNVEEINESKQLSAFQNVHDSLLEHHLSTPPQQSVPALDTEQMLQNFRYLSMHANDE